MPREASDATLLKRERAERRRLENETYEARNSIAALKRQVDRLEKERDEWKNRFDLLLKRETSIGQSGADGRTG